MVIGITGGFCTGKSKVAKIFKNLGAKIMDLDKLAHKTLKPTTKSYKAIIKKFGKGILIKNNIDRSLLAKKVFNNKKNLAKLNSIIHPIVIKQMLSLINKFKKKNIVVVEAPLLFEANLKEYFNYIIVVKTTKKVQLERAVKKEGFHRLDALQRINMQWPLKKKISSADFVVDNNKSIREIREQIKIIWNKLNFIKKNNKF
ncbi:MAG: dephospho-CoA kinase [Candidatus Omnitrophota bacterium]